MPKAVHANRRTLHLLLPRQDPGGLKEFAARYGLGGAILFDYSCGPSNTTTTSIARTGAAPLRGDCRAPSVHWCSSTRRAACAAAEGSAALPLPSTKEFSHLAGSQARDPHRGLCRDRRLGIHYDLRWSMSITAPSPIISGVKRSFPPISPRWKPMRCWPTRSRGRSASACA